MLEDPFRLSDEVVVAVAALRPMSATFWGIPGHDAEWDDLSPEGNARAQACLAAFAARVPEPGGDRWSRLATDVLADFLRLELDRYAHDDPRRDLNHIASPFQLVRMVFDAMDPDASDARLRRLETLDDALDGYRRTLATGLDAGDVVAARQVRAVIVQGRVIAGEGSPFRAMKGGDPARMGAAVEGACAAYGRLSDWLEQVYLPRARATDGVGRERYVRQAWRFLGMAIDPEETYAWGWREIASVRSQMDALAAKIAPGKTVPEVLALLTQDPAYGAPDIDTFLTRMRARQHDALAQLAGTHFDVPAPVRTLDVKLAPPGGPLGAYYSAPSDGFGRPGCVWYAPGDGKAFPIFDQVSTAYHEGFPGHHLQVGIQVALTSRLSRLHRVADGYSGYAEGWALYAEQLMAELGYYEEPAWHFGMLANQVIRACRVVIDIGSHLGLSIPTDQPFHPGEAWTFEAGVEMLTGMGGLSPDRAESEVTRYLGWPGQVISYKVGQRVILELRAAERARLGAAFDPKAFHANVLGSGNVGLDHLRRLFMP